MTALAIINGIAIVVLVAVTAYYAWQTHEMADEMKQARLLSLAPNVRLDVRMLSAVYGVPVARNVGTGPALDCDLHLHFGARDHTIDHRRWLAQVLAPGDEHQILPPEGVANISNLVGRFPVIRLEGNVSDVFGERHVVDETMDLVDWWTNLERAGRRFEEEPAALAVRELEGIKKELAAIRAKMP